MSRARSTSAELPADFVSTRNAAILRALPAMRQMANRLIRKYESSKAKVQAADLIAETVQDAIAGLCHVGNRETDFSIAYCCGTLRNIYFTLRRRKWDHFDRTVSLDECYNLSQPATQEARVAYNEFLVKFAKLPKCQQAAVRSLVTDEPVLGKHQHLYLARKALNPEGRPHKPRSRS